MGKVKTYFSKAQDSTRKIEREIKNFSKQAAKVMFQNTAMSLIEPAADYLRYSHQRAGRLLSAVATAKYQGYDNLELNEHDPLAGPIDTEEHSEEILREEAAREELLAKYLN